MAAGAAVVVKGERRWDRARPPGAGCVWRRREGTRERRGDRDRAQGVRARVKGLRGAAGPWANWTAGKQAGLALRPKWPTGLLSLPHISSSYPYTI